MRAAPGRLQLLACSPARNDFQAIFDSFLKEPSMRFVSARHPGVGAHRCVTSLPPTHPCRQPCLPCPLERPKAATGDSIRPKSGRLCSESWAEERGSRHCGALPCCMPPAKRFHLAQQQQPPTHQSSGPSFCMLYHALDTSDIASSACTSMPQTRPADAATSWFGCRHQARKSRNSSPTPP